MQDALWLHAIDFNLRCLGYREMRNNFPNLTELISYFSEIPTIYYEFLKFKLIFYNLNQQFKSEIYILKSIINIRSKLIRFKFETNYEL